MYCQWQYEFKWLSDTEMPVPHCTKKWSFPLRISSVTVTKSAGNWGNLNGKLHFLCSAEISMWFYFISIFLFFQHQTQFTNKAKIIKLKHQNYLLKYYPTQSKATPTQSNITTKNFLTAILILAYWCRVNIHHFITLRHILKGASIELIWNIENSLWKSYNYEENHQVGVLKP